MTGYGDGNFGPNDWIIHQQFAQMIDLTMGYPVTEDQTSTTSPTQPPIVHLDGVLYPYHYVAAAALQGAMATYGDGTFRPLYRERGNEAVGPRWRRRRRSSASPPTTTPRTLTDTDAVMAVALRVAEYNGLLDNIVGPDGTLSWDPTPPPPGRRSPSSSGTSTRVLHARHSPPLPDAGPATGGRPGPTGLCPLRRRPSPLAAPHFLPG